MESVMREEMNNEAVKPQKEGGLTGSTLKWIAIVTMFIDHFAAAYLTRILIDRGYYDIMLGSDQDAMIAFSQANAVLILVITKMCGKNCISNLLFLVGRRIYAYFQCKEVCASFGIVCCGNRGSVQSCNCRIAVLYAIPERYGDATHCNAYALRP